MRVKFHQLCHMHAKRMQWTGTINWSISYICVGSPNLPCDLPVTHTEPRMLIDFATYQIDYHSSIEQQLIKHACSFNKYPKLTEAAAWNKHNTWVGFFYSRIIFFYFFLTGIVFAYIYIFLFSGIPHGMEVIIISCCEKLLSKASRYPPTRLQA